MNKTLLRIGLIATLGLAGCKATTEPFDTIEGGVLPPVSGQPIQPPTPEPNNPFPEPKSDKYDPSNGNIGFYDYNSQGEVRVVRNDLEGDFRAMVQFGQAHTVDPANNESKNMPRLVSERAALLLITPDPAHADINELTVDVSVNQARKETLTLSSPKAIPSADNSKLGTEITYSKRAWSVELPWDYVVPGLSLTIIDSAGRQGNLPASNIEFAAPGQLVINQIQLGMLTDHPGTEHMLREPENAGTDYFQTIPAASMLVGSYEPMRLERVMIDSGVIYTFPGVSQSNGGVYDGDMRENVGKATFSTGINLANYGVTSARLGSQEQPGLTQRAVTHHARGNYKNGEHNHGLSGGNGMLTLLNSHGNEFSHEIGHHYGLGHYPGGGIEIPEKDYWSRHHTESGWGYIAYRKRMRGNLNWASSTDGQVPSRIFKGYVFASDPMSGGHSSSSLSRYSFYTGFSTHLKIQPAFDRVQYSCDTATNTVTGSGFLKWNKDTQKMEEIYPEVPSSNNVWYNNGDGNGYYLKPRLCQVPVFTLLGGYDPEKKTAVMYPAARSNLGNVFNLPAPTISTRERRCWVQIDFNDGTQKNIAIAPNRLGGTGNVNRYNINIAQADKPTAAALYCQEPGEQAKQLDAGIIIPTDLEPMPAAVVIGKEHGYDALWQKEKPELIAALNALDEQVIPNLSERGLLLYNSWASKYANELPNREQRAIKRYEDFNKSILRLNRWMFAWQKELTGNNPEADAALLALIEKLELGAADALLPKATKMTIGYNSCLRIDTSGSGAPLLKAYGSDECTGELNETWIADALGRIHNGADLSQCITGTNPVTVTTCSLSVDSQVWNLNDLPRIRRGSCMDMKGGTLGGKGQKDIILYGCGGGMNQKFENISQDENNALLPLLHPNNLPIIQRLSNERVLSNLR